ncbi:F-box/FBD/LRR-repeat protein At1g78750-like isoform X2 [Papaver somniferum]|nr:F-box/FBD/LRR-repeat protein At1g78750-like isoform X2 [Papaver somniferum]
MSLPQLKKLYLCGLSISNVESSKRLFSSCPVLEALEMVDCNIQTDNQRNLVVHSDTFKVFAHTCWSRGLLLQNDTMANVIKLSAPNLEEFTCRSFLKQDYCLEICSPPSLVCFDMTEENEEDENAEDCSELLPDEKEVYAKRAMQFLRAVYMVKTMRLSPGFLEVLSHAPDVLDCQHPRLCDLQYLTLGMWSTRGCLRAIAYLLRISPNIVELYLELKESNSVDVGDDWEAGLSSPGMLSNLKIVEIEDVEGCVAEFNILSFLLKNANDLAKVVISFCSCAGSQVQRFKQMLRAVPTASSDVELVFHK